MDKGKIIQGTPSMVLLPARNYVFRVSNENYVIEIPRKGAYTEVAPEIFNKADGEFNIYDDQSGILYMPSITKVLFAASKYPDLKSTELFVPYVIKFTEDTVTIVGSVVEMLLSKLNEDTTNG